MKRTLGLTLALLLCLGAGAWAQSAGGNIYGTVTDESGAVLPGATITARSAATNATRTTTSSSQGDFRFLNLDPGNYKVTVTLQGFATVNRELIITTGVNANVTFGLKVASMQEDVTVTAETPVVDTKKTGTSTTMDKDELTKVPQGRDPWAVLKTVPGVLVDRVSIAGNEAGQQSLFVGKGAQFTDTMWNIDGVTVTDVTSYGASANYYDFDAFDEINVQSGGGDLKVQTGGLGLNFVTKRGTNAFHGGVHSYFSHNDLQSTNTPSELAGNPGLKDGKADHIEQINDYGAELGGPIIKDKLWFWGSYGKNDIRLYRFNSASQDKTLITAWNAKLNWQPGASDNISFFFFNGIKSKYNRDLGFGGTGSNAALSNQGSFYQESDCGLPCGLHGLFKLEWNHTFSPNFFLNGKYAFFNWGYGFDPVNGTSQDLGINRVSDTNYGSGPAYRFLKPWHIANLDGSYFATGWGGNHEIKFGFGYRHNPNLSSVSFVNNEVAAVTNVPDNPTGNVAWVTRGGAIHFTGNYTSAYLGDTFTKGRATVNAGVRWDHQTAQNDYGSSAANPLFPDLVPSLNFNLSSLPKISWNDFSPRISMTYALGESRKTVARASYARYAGQLGPIDASFNSPVSYGYSYLAYRWVDLNHDGFAQKNEILTNQGVVYQSPTFFSGGSLATTNKIDSNYHANHDSEIIAGLEHELMPNFSVGVAYTWRRGTGTVDYTARVDPNGIPYTPADYVALAPVSDNGRTAQPYALAPGLDPGSFLLTNRNDHNLSYNGIEFTALKRLSNKWFMRAALSWMDWTEHFDGIGAFQNPTSVQQDAIVQGGGIGSGYNQLCGPCVEGGPVALKSYGAKTNTFASSDWQVSVNGIYQLPAGFELGGALIGRQGYPLNAVITTSLGVDGGSRGVVPAGGIDAQRLGDFWNFDLRLAKTIKLGGSFHANIAADLFNVFNTATILQSNRQLASSAFGSILEVPNPRILRIGVRLEF